MRPRANAGFALVTFLMASCAAYPGAGEGEPVAERVEAPAPGIPALREDAFDRPAPESIAEAAKSPGGAHPAHGAAPGDSSLAVRYACPMHPEVTSDAPGSCPKCGMALVKQERAEALFACPMHPEVTSDAPGKCPKCGMALVRRKD